MKKNKEEKKIIIDEGSSKVKEKGKEKVEEEVCRFVSKQGEGCSETEILRFGFCKKHAKTIQGRQAKDLYEKVQLEQEIFNRQKKFREEENNKKSIEIKNKEKKNKKEYEDKKRKIKEELIEEHDEIEESDYQITLKRNKYGRFEEPVSHIVFDSNSKKAYGVQGKDGDLLPLSKRHMEICSRNSWEYI